MLELRYSDSFNRWCYKEYIVATQATYFFDKLFTSLIRVDTLLVVFVRRVAFQHPCLHTTNVGMPVGPPVPILSHLRHLLGQLYDPRR